MRKILPEKQVKKSITSDYKIDFLVIGNQSMLDKAKENDLLTEIYYQNL